MGRFPILATVLLAVMLTACGTAAKTSGGPPGSPAIEDAPIARASDGEIMVSCADNAGWPPSLMAEGIQGVLSEDEARGIFESILEIANLHSAAGSSIAAARREVMTSAQSVNAASDPSPVAWRYLQSQG